MIGKLCHMASDCQVKKSVYKCKSFMNNGDKWFNCNNQAGHIVKDCAEPKKNSKSSTRETGIFVGSGCLTTRTE